jgi:hypothetical protein
MATKPNFSGRRLILRFGDGASPEAFAIKCSFNGDRAISFEAQTTDEMDIDCDDPTAVGWMVSQVDSLSGTASGAGRVKADEVPFFFDYLTSGEAKNAQVAIDAPDGGEFEGALILTAFTLNGGETGSATADMAFRFTGPVTYTPA